MTDSLSTSSPVIKKKTRISAIWILPILAVCIGLSLFYMQWQNRGQSINITFENANGLEVNKTRMKYKDVDIGVLKDIKFSDNDESIIAHVMVEREMARFLRSDSQFWVVRPRVGSSGISGISTLLSGAYITMEPGKSEQLASQFIGLESPPVASPNDEGLKINLLSDGGKHLREGNPVLYRGFEVGAVEAVNFDVESREISYDVFIRAPYHNLITTNTYFWNAGGFELTTSAQGLTVDFSSIESFVSGGVQFDIPDDLNLGERVTQTRDFRLYPNKRSITEDREYDYIEFVMLVSGSIAGIEPGSPVEYRGIRVGKVDKPYLGFHQTKLISPDEVRIPVVIRIEPRRLTQHESYTLDWFQNQFEQWIREGLSATVETANILTGAMKISLDMNLEPTDTIETFGNYTVIPVGESDFDGILQKTENLLAKLNELDIESMLASIENTMDTATQKLADADTLIQSSSAMIENVNNTILEAQTTLKGMQPGSPVYQELEGNLIKLQQTMDQLQPFIEKISAKPNLLIFSDQPQADPEPQGK